MDSTSELVALKGGYVIPLPALELALALEARDLRLTVQETENGPMLRVSERGGGKPVLTESEVTSIRQWKFHLLALVAYDPEAQLGAQLAQPASSAPPRKRRKAQSVV